MWRLRLSKYFGNDFLSDGIAYRCSETMSECYIEDHYTWENFYTEYGDVCIMVSTRALQRLGFEMMHGDKLEDLLNDPTKYIDTNVEHTWNWQPDWIVTEWINFLDGKIKLQPEDEPWEKPDEREEELIDKFRRGVWPITNAKPFSILDDDLDDMYKREKLRLENMWSEINPESKQDFINLLLTAYKKAPWWVYKNVSASVKTSSHGLINEFKTRYKQREGTVENKDIELTNRCILAKRVGNRIVYVLDPEITPGSEEAGQYYEAQNQRKRRKTK